MKKLGLKFFSILMIGFFLHAPARAFGPGDEETGGHAEFEAVDSEGNSVTIRADWSEVTSEEMMEAARSYAAAMKSNPGRNSMRVVAVTDSMHLSHDLIERVTAAMAEAHANPHVLELPAELETPQDSKVDIQRIRTIGVITAVSRVAVDAILWFSAGLPGPAMAMLGASTLGMGLAQYPFIEKWDNHFSNRDLKTGVAKNKPIAEFFKRFAFAVGINEATRFLSGPTQDAHAINTLTGQVEIFTNALIFSGASGIFQIIRNRTMPLRTTPYLLMNFTLIMSIFDTMDIVGYHLFKIVDYAGVQFNGSNVVMLGVGLLSCLTLQKFKEKVIQFADWQDQLFMRFKKWREENQAPPRREPLTANEILALDCKGAFGI